MNLEMFRIAMVQLIINDEFLINIKKEKSIANEQFCNLTTNKSRGFNERKS